MKKKTEEAKCYGCLYKYMCPHPYLKLRVCLRQNQKCNSSKVKKSTVLVKVSWSLTQLFIKRVNSSITCCAIEHTTDRVSQMIPFHA